MKPQSLKRRSDRLKHKRVVSRKKQQGISLVQAVIVMGLFSFMTVQMIPVESDKFNDRYVIGASRIGMEQLAQAAVAFRTDPSGGNYGNWPMDINAVINGGYLPDFSNRNGRGRPYTLTTNGHGLQISTEMDSEHEARMLAAGFGPIGQVVMLCNGAEPLPDDPDCDSGVVTASARITLPIPGYESSHNELYARDGSRPLTGDMDAGGKTIKNAGRVYAHVFSDQSDPSYYLDPNADSRINHLSAKTINATENIRAGRYYSWPSNNPPRAYAPEEINQHFMDPLFDSNVYKLTAKELVATTDIRAPRYYDSDNSTYYLDPHNTSNLNVANARHFVSSIDTRAPRFYDSNNLAYYVDPQSLSKVNAIEGVRFNASYYVEAPQFLDPDTSHSDHEGNRYRLDVAGESSISFLKTNTLRVMHDYNEGGTCEGKAIGTTGAGHLVSCINGTWRLYIPR